LFNRWCLVIVIIEKAQNKYSECCRDYSYNKIDTFFLIHDGEDYKVRIPLGATLLVSCSLNDIKNHKR
jgi:hypothetical protein